MWLEVGASDEPNRNIVYDKPMVSTHEIRVDQTISTIGIPYFVLNNTTQNFDELV